MNKVERSKPKDTSLENLLIEICFKEEIEENNLFLAASLAYFFGVVFVTLMGEVETYFGVVLILTAIMIIWGLRGWRKTIRRKYEKHIEELLKRNEA